jgi:elongation factor Ts
VLVDQIFIRDAEGKQKIKDVLATAGKQLGAPVRVARFVRYRLGEGVQRRTE